MILINQDDLNSISKPVLVIEYCNLFVICLPAVFLAGCLLFEILTAYMSSAIDTIRSASIFT